MIKHTHEETKRLKETYGHTLNDEPCKACGEKEESYLWSQIKGALDFIRWPYMIMMLVIPIFAFFAGGIWWALGLLILAGFISSTHL